MNNSLTLKFMKAFVMYAFVMTFILGCTSDNSDERPFCSEYNVQSPDDNFIPCEDEESPCKCG
ncbi:hypothetical protein [Winogradskyella ouciana]|uniref:hypothetical protein n=1 Tax=Winogradskyella ouciana TaxID=2608631 RepID=UPI003D26C926